MRALPACAALSSELLWWELLIDASQCWGNRLKKSFWESLERTVYLVKNDALPCRQVQDLGSAKHFAEYGNEVGNISRVSDATCPPSAEKVRRLFPKVYRGFENMFGFACATVQERPMNSGVDFDMFTSSIWADPCTRSGARENAKRSSFGNWMSWDAMFGWTHLGTESLAVELFEKVQEEGVRHNKITLLSMLRARGHGQCVDRSATSCSLGQNAALYTQNESATEAASILESTFSEICAEYGGLEEASFTIDNIRRQRSVIMDPTGFNLMGRSSLGVLFEKASSFIHISWMEQKGSKSNDNIYLNILKSYGGIGLAKFGMLLHDYVISNELEVNTCFWSALADLYVKGGMLMDAHDVFKSQEISLDVHFRALIEGFALPGECSKYMEQEGGRSNANVNSGWLPRSHEGPSNKGQIAHNCSKHSMMRTNLFHSSACLKELNGFERSLSSVAFRRAMSTSTEKQCDEDVGEQQNPSQQPSASQQQSSLELPESKPQGGSSWPNPDNAASYVLMSNIYADGDRWDEVKRINEMRLKARAWKKPGKAYVEIKAKVHEFIVGDRTHQDSVNIYEKLRKIKRHMGHIGYVPNVDLILENRSYYDPYKPR